jgi:hypothetical protein
LRDFAYRLVVAARLQGNAGFLFGTSSFASHALLQSLFKLPI